MAMLALLFYAIGSYSLYKNKRRFLLFIGLALLIDILTATLASLRITPTTELPAAVSVPWYSLLFKIHVMLSMTGITGFIILFLYLLFVKRDRIKDWVRKWQYQLLLPIWIIGEGIALSNSIMKICCGIRLFDWF